MPFIGNQPALSYTSFAKQDFTTSATTSYTLDHPVTNENEIALFINFVRQEPTTAYSASGTSLTLTSATSASDDMYCVFLGKAVQTVNPPNGSVGTAQIADLAVTSGKLASGVLPDNTPAFEAKLSSNQSISHSTVTLATYNSEVFDTDNCYDHTTNYRFTPNLAGKYFVYTTGVYDAGGIDRYHYTEHKIRKNGSNVRSSYFDNYDNYFLYGTTNATYAIIDMNGSSDYVDVTARYNSQSTQAGAITSDSVFGAFKLIGV